MAIRIEKIFVTIILLIFFSGLSLSQTEHIFREFEYDQFADKIRIVVEGGIEYSVEKIIITADEFILSKYEHSPIESLYKDTQSYFKSLIGKTVTIVKRSTISGEFLYRLNSQETLNSD